MSKGSKIVPVRMCDGALELLDAAIESANRTRFAEPFTRSSWIRQAAYEKLAHLKRSKKTHRKEGVK